MFLTVMEAQTTSYQVVAREAQLVAALEAVQAVTGTFQSVMLGEAVTTTAADKSEIKERVLILD